MNIKPSSARSRIICALFFTLGMCSSQAAEEFPSYLNEKYCEDIKLDFMTSAIKSLQRYREQQLVSQHRGGMNNIRKYLIQRKEWLLECDSYLDAAENDRLFKDKQTTDGIFSAIDSVSEELQSLISGITYSVDQGQSPTAVAGEKFDKLFKLVDDHQTMLLLKGQVVYR